MKRVLIVSVILVLSLNSLFSQVKNRSYLGVFFGPSTFTEAGSLGKPKALDGSLGDVFKVLGADGVSYEHVNSLGISIGLEAGYNISSSIGIGTNLTLSIPLSFSYDAFGKEYTHKSEDWDNFLGFDMLIGPIFVFNDYFKLLSGFHFDTYTLKASKNFSFLDTGIQLSSVSSILQYTSLGIGFSFQGRLNLTPTFYGFVNMHAGFDFFEIKRINSELSVSIPIPGFSARSFSGSASWSGGTFNFELTPVVGIGLNY